MPPVQDPPVVWRSARVFGDGIVMIPITLSDAAERLQIDTKTLRKRYQDLGIVPEPDPKDRRNKLLTPEQFELIREDVTQARRRSMDYQTQPPLPNDDARPLRAEEITEVLLAKAQAQIQAQAEAVLQERQRYLEQWEMRLSERERQVHEKIMTLLQRDDQLRIDHASELELLRRGEEGQSRK